VSLGPSGINIRHSTDSPLANKHVMNSPFVADRLRFVSVQLQSSRSAPLLHVHDTVAELAT